MPRYFFDIYNEVDSRDEEGTDLADLQAVRDQVRRTLPALLKEVKASEDAAQYRVDVRDADGRRVVTSTICMIMQTTKPEVA